MSLHDEILTAIEQTVEAHFKGNALVNREQVEAEKQAQQYTFEIGTLVVKQNPYAAAVDLEYPTQYPEGTGKYPPDPQGRRPARVPRGEPAAAERLDPGRDGVPVPLRGEGEPVRRRPQRGPPARGARPARQGQLHGRRQVPAQRHQDGPAALRDEEPDRPEREAEQGLGPDPLLRRRRVRPPPLQPPPLQGGRGQGRMPSWRLIARASACIDPARAGSMPGTAARRASARASSWGRPAARARSTASSKAATAAG